MNTFLWVMSASLTACAITTAGILVISRYESWAKQNAIYFISFAAGMLLTVSLVHLVPESLDLLPSSALFLLPGFLVVYLSHHFLRQSNDHVRRNASAIIPLIGIGFHSLVDGLIYAVTFEVSIFTGALAAVGMIMHEFPEGVFTYVLLQRGGFSRGWSILYAFLVAALSTPLGTLISYPFVRRIDDTVLGALLAFSAGVLVYVGASHLVPEIEKSPRKGVLLPLFGGVAVGLLLLLTRNGG